MKKRKIKRVIASAMALLMMINALPVTDGWFHPMTSYASTARVNATSLNVRSGPGTTYSIAGKLTNGKTVTVLGQTTGSGWQDMESDPFHRNWWCRNYRVCAFNIFKESDVIFPRWKF